MTGKKQLSPVWAVEPEADPSAPASEPLSLRQAVESGSRLDELKAMRLILVTHMEHENTLARDLAALTRQVREISKEIEALEVQEAERLKSAGEDGGVDGGSADQEWDTSEI